MKNSNNQKYMVAPNKCPIIGYSSNKNGSKISIFPPLNLIKYANISPKKPKILNTTIIGNMPTIVNPNNNANPNNTIIGNNNILNKNLKLKIGMLSFGIISLIFFLQRQTIFN